MGIRDINERAVIGSLDHSFHYKRNVLKLSRHETFINRLAQFFLANEILDNGNDFISEGVFAGGLGRADLIDVQNKLIIEVRDSEHKKNIKNKEFKYPFEIMDFDALDVVKKNVNKLLKDLEK